MNMSRLAGEHIGEYDGISVGQDEKLEILDKIGTFHPKPKAHTYIIIALSIFTFSLGIYLCIKHLGTNDIISLFAFALAALSMTNGISAWIMGGIRPYFRWKKDCRIIMKYDIRKVEIKAYDTVEASGHYKDKLIFFKIKDTAFDKPYQVKDDVYNNIEDVNLWAYYCKYDTSDYGIFIVGE